MKDFIPYNEALVLKELGFDEPCFGIITGVYGENPPLVVELAGSKEWKRETLTYCTSWQEGWVLIPLYSQAFRWFRDNHNLTHMVSDNLEAFVFAVEGALMFGKIYDTYEEAELACLKKLIEIVKQIK